MDIQVRKLSASEAAALREEYRQSQERATGTMQVFASEQAKREHLDYVRAMLADASGPTPF